MSSDGITEKTLRDMLEADLLTVGDYLRLCRQHGFKPSIG